QQRNTYLCAWYIRNYSSVETLYTEETQKLPLFPYCMKVHIFPEKVEVEIHDADKWDISIFTHSGKVSLFNRWSAHACVSSASAIGEEFKKLKQLPNNDCVITCRKIRFKEGIPKSAIISSETPAKNSEYLNSLKSGLKNYPGDFSKEKVSLRVGTETEVVNKAVLCARSPVFAKMFEADMKELKEKTVTITDIKMPVLKTLVSYLYSGFLPDCDFHFLCDLYYVASKYDIMELQLACIRLLLGKVTLKNMFRVLKLSLSHNDELLKSVAMTLLSANIETIILTPHWKNLMHDDPEIALEASTFFDL
ncbi:Speckle-type POZ protein, partial [Araneus ventricosus]